MSHKRRKAKNWEDLDENSKTELSDLRAKEVEFKNKSGYIKWISYFVPGTIFYSFLFYNFYLKKITHPPKIKQLILFVGPILLYGFSLCKAFYDPNAFKEYYDTHIEINRKIKKAFQSSEYK
jgi:hypothetical protein